MRACVEEFLFMMFMILGGVGFGDFREDRDRGTYLGVSISCSVDRPEH